MLGWNCVCAVEIEPYARAVLCARQNDGLLPPFPIWDDVCTFDGKPWNGIVDVVSGGFPCQDISIAGGGKGLDGERSGLWYEMSRIIGEVRPQYAFVENSPMLTSRGISRVLGDLAEMGYDAKWGVVSAENAGAPHRRKRIWILANDSKARLQVPRKEQVEKDREQSRRLPTASTWWASEPELGRVAHGVAARVDRIKAVGNGQVPQVMAMAWEALGGPLMVAS